MTLTCRRVHWRHCTVCTCEYAVKYRRGISANDKTSDVRDVCRWMKWVSVIGIKHASACVGGRQRGHAPGAKCVWSPHAAFRQTTNVAQSARRTHYHQRWWSRNWVITAFGLTTLAYLLCIYTGVWLTPKTISPLPICGTTSNLVVLRQRMHA